MALRRQAESNYILGGGVTVPRTLLSAVGDRAFPVAAVPVSGMNHAHHYVCAVPASFLPSFQDLSFQSSLQSSLFRLSVVPACEVIFIIGHFNSFYYSLTYLLIYFLTFLLYRWCFSGYGWIRTSWVRRRQLLRWATVDRSPISGVQFRAEQVLVTMDPTPDAAAWCPSAEWAATTTATRAFAAAAAHLVAASPFSWPRANSIAPTWKLSTTSSDRISRLDDGFFV